MKVTIIAPDLLEALKTLAEQADEDTPQEYRSKHFKHALDEAYATIRRAENESGS